MKKYVLLLLAATIVAAAEAQTNYYDGQTIYIDPTLTLKCDNDGSGIILENIHDPVIDVEFPANSDPNEVALMMAQNQCFVSNQAFLSAFHETFTASELTSLANQSILVDFTINQQGDVVSCGLIFDNVPCFLAISPQKYALLYKKLKTYVKVYVQNKQINYWSTGGTIYINDVIANKLVRNPQDYISVGNVLGGGGFPVLPATSCPIFTVNYGDIITDPMFINPLDDTGTIKKFFGTNDITLANKSYTVAFGLLSGYENQQDSGFNVIQFYSGTQPVLTIKQPALWSYVKYANIANNDFAKYLEQYAENKYFFRVKVSDYLHILVFVRWLDRISTKAQVIAVAATQKDIKVVLNKELLIKTVDPESGVKVDDWGKTHIITIQNGTLYLR